MLTILPLHRQECLDRLHRGLGREFLHPRPQGPPEGVEEGQVQHWDRALIHSRHPLKTVPVEGPQHHQGPHTPQPRAVRSLTVG